ncbi:MAG TPA: hypothetical protein VEK14_03905 [Rhodomicrobium sp.]|nr:hypothetical protein [Rhodomicrobium sp.]
MTETQSVNAKALAARILHDPRRADNLDLLEAHVSRAAAFSRAMWRLLDAEEFGCDERDHSALRLLADALADRASAAEFILETKRETCK